MNIKKLYLVIVIYNKKLKDCITLNQINKFNLKNIETIVIDNSTQKINNKTDINNKKIHYISMDGNKGLSKAYNTAIEYVLKKINANYDDYIIWFDDDTLITKEYFDELEKRVKIDDSFDIIAPIIYGQDERIYSPNNKGYIKNKLVKNETETHKLNKYNAINSCLCVKLKNYEKYRYDENLFLDQIDTNFFDDMRKNNKKFLTLDIKIKQNFSQREKKLDSKNMLIRCKIRTKDIMVYGRKKISHSILSLIKSIGVTFQIGIKCKSIKLIFICFYIAIKYFLKNIFFIILKKDC